MVTRGEKVLVRSFGDKLLVRRIWELGERVAYLCSERQFSELAEGRDGPPPIGFPREDVFVYEQLPADVRIEWNRLQPIANG